MDRQNHLLLGESLLVDTHSLNWAADLETDLKVQFTTNIQS